MSRLDHYAILVAINRYPGLSDLAGPENDANEFFKWLIDPAGGDLQDPAGIQPEQRRVEIIRSSDYTVVTDPYEANPTETHFKKALNRWLKADGEWRDRVGERLYLFFAGHGFTSGALEDPALFTAQAQNGDTAHIAGFRYASKIRNSGFFDEIVLIMDCCQDVLKASPVSDPTWNPPDRQRSSQVKFMQAYGAPRGRKAFEIANASGEVHGYFSAVFLDAVKNAQADSNNNVSARAIEDKFSELWEERGYFKLMGYQPPFSGTGKWTFYHRNIMPIPVTVECTDVVPDKLLDMNELMTDMLGSKQISLSLESTGVPSRVFSLRKSPKKLGIPGINPGVDRLIGKAVEPHSREDRLVKITVELHSRDPGVRISVIDAQKKLIVEDLEYVKTALSPGQYTARFRLGDAVAEHKFRLKDNRKSPLKIVQPDLQFSSPMPMEGTSTNHEYHSCPARDILSHAAEQASPIDSSSSVATLMVFARDSAHQVNTAWRMSEEVRQGLRFRRLDDETGEFHSVPCEVAVDGNCGYSSVLLNRLFPGTYLLGVRRLLRELWTWQEMVLTVAPGWRTEVYLDSVEDDFTERRYDIESASVYITLVTSGNSLYGSDARHTEQVRIALMEGSLLLGRTHPDASYPGDPGSFDRYSPMYHLYRAYALAFSREPDWSHVRALCEHLKATWTDRSADVKLLEGWCASAGAKENLPEKINFRPDEVPMIARGWEIAAKLGHSGALAESVQYNVGMWRTSSRLWTQTQVPVDVDPWRTHEPDSIGLFSLRMDAGIHSKRISPDWVPFSHRYSPLQQSLRRALMDAHEMGEEGQLDAAMEKIAVASGLELNIVKYAMNELIEQSSDGSMNKPD